MFLTDFVINTLPVIKGVGVGLSTVTMESINNTIDAVLSNIDVVSPNVHHDGSLTYTYFYNT
jgi:hypothetical protein